MNDKTLLDTRPRVRVGPGAHLNELYEIDALIAVGGMGEVFRGRVIETGDLVAIKTIRSEFAEDANAIALFRKEASALHTVNHGAIVRYYVFSIDRRLNIPYLAMEYVTGESLAERLKRGPLDYDAVEVLLRRLAGGLGAAHEAGIVHRDVSPDNIILPASDPAKAKIIDFGIARLLATQTVIGDGFAGKYDYVSPEQLGLQGGIVAAKSDIYSLGLVLAQASLGRPLDMGGSPAELVAKRSKVPDLAGVDDRLVPLLETMLRPDPRMRPESMADIEAWKSPVLSAKSGRVAKISPLRSRRGLQNLGIGGAVAALMAGITAVALLPSSEPPAPGTGPPLSEPQPAPPQQPAPPPAEQTTQGSGTDARPIPESPSAEPPAEPASNRNIPPGAAMEPPSPAAPTMEQVATYIRNYSGGDCFFLNPTTVSSQEALIEAYGARTQPFVDFDTAFKKVVGFEAKIQLRQVEPAQCPVVELLTQQAQAKPASVPKLQLNSDRVRSGDVLRGSIDVSEALNLGLLLVEGDGTVHDLGPYLMRSGRQASFAVPLEIPPSNRGRSQLVVAVTSRQPLGALGSNRGMQSAALFANLAQEAKRPDFAIGLAVRYIKVGI